MNAEGYLLMLGLVHDDGLWRLKTDGIGKGQDAATALIAQKGDIIRMAFEPALGEPLSMKQAMEALRLISAMEKKPA